MASIELQSLFALGTTLLTDDIVTSVSSGWTFALDTKLNTRAGLGEATKNMLN